MSQFAAARRSSAHGHDDGESLWLSSRQPQRRQQQQQRYRRHDDTMRGQEDDTNRGYHPRPRLPQSQQQQQQAIRNGDNDDNDDAFMEDTNDTQRQRRRRHDNDESGFDMGNDHGHFHQATASTPSATTMSTAAHQRQDVRLDEIDWDKDDDENDDEQEDNDDENDDPSIVSTHEVLCRIEAVAARLVQYLDDYKVPEMTQFGSISSSSSNSDASNKRHRRGGGGGAAAAAAAMDDDDDDDEDDDRDRDNEDDNESIQASQQPQQRHQQLQPKVLKKRFTLQQCRSFTSVLLVVSYCHALLLTHLQAAASGEAKKTVTTREVYYVYVTHFRHQRECNDAIQHACTLLQVPRHALGLQASSRGWICGDVTLWHHGHGQTSTDDVAYGNDGTTSHARNSESNGMPIAADWLLPPSQRSFTLHPTTTARCIVLIEKEGIYQRLVQDDVWHEHHCILVTGKGFPDWATRACVHVLHTTWPHLPIYGLADCDPYGIAVLQCFARGCLSNNGQKAATKTPNSQYSIPVQWMGLRPSQVKFFSQPRSIAWSNVDDDDDDDQADGDDRDGDEPNGAILYPALPNAVRQQLTTRDVNLLRQFLGSGSSATERSVDASLPPTCHPFPNLSPSRHQDEDEEDDNDSTDSTFAQQRHTWHWQRDELKHMMRNEYKVELEALYWLGMDFCALFVGRLVELQNAAAAAAATAAQNESTSNNGRRSTSEDAPDWSDIL